MQEWTQFYAVVAAVAATLMGLLFVAVSVNAVESVGAGRETSRRLSEQALQNYLATLLISLVALTPNINTKTFGFVAICLTAIGGALTVMRFGLHLFKAGGEADGLGSVRRYGTSLLGFGLLIFAAIRMSLGDVEHRNTFAAAILVLLGSATMVSWELLLRIARRSSLDP